MAEEPLPELGAHDLARLYALEHMVTTLWSFYAAQQADVFGLTVEAVARDLSSGVQGTIVETRMPIGFRDLMREKVRGLMNTVIENARTMDELSGKAGHSG